MIRDRFGDIPKMSIELHPRTLPGMNKEQLLSARIMQKSNLVRKSEVHITKHLTRGSFMLNS